MMLTVCGAYFSRMLEDPELQGAIEWKTDSSFIVPDPEYFARSVRALSSRPLSAS